MPKINDIIGHLENIAPTSYQEPYDNSGLLTGQRDWEITGILISLDCIESIVDEAIEKGCNMIIAHHPIIFTGLKKLTGSNYVEKTIIKAIKNDVAIYAIHTNLDNISEGVNAMISGKIGLINTRILLPKSHSLSKIEFFVPKENTQSILDTIHAVGAGKMGKYNHCSFRVNGTGTFLALDEAKPSIGQRGQIESVNEDKVEVIFPSYLHLRIVEALRKAHPYEEPAFFIISLDNQNKEVGSGMIGEFEKPLSQEEFLQHLKNTLPINTIKYTPSHKKEIRTVAVCGGAGSFLLPTAKSLKADAFVSSDFKYHEFFDAENKIMIADIGHYESEVYTKALLDEFVREKFTNIATYLSEVNTNPVQYF
jgi:dinuclear metal center YbgI/SA1388 family protein